MIINNLLLKLRNRDTDNIKKTQEILLSMRGKIEVLKDIQAEINIRPGGSNYDIILITKFSTLEDLDKYLAHPKHLEVAQFIGSVLDTQASVCYKL
ncbi:Dabb family protein [Clostridium chromiireducens]|uniref:Dabb family protein n=1 Tax=Clostridium chromiireducens TaxID=225345 RepID=A0A1V4IHU1_9CLOT|nr:Dabb family protein [Clostridium chromiireducens]OPJ59087.1 stress responsive A/B barrel domain protein [Clostridium chromiireducens]RII31879.1 Dabb family protein [Clostridium chromiireducens]